jgi:predicted site-specific integrase-resolvase
MKKNENKFDLINSNEAAIMLDLSKTTVFKLVQTGKIKPAYVQKQFSLFELSEIERYLETMKSK